MCNVLYVIYMRYKIKLLSMNFMTYSRANEDIQLEYE